MDSLTRKEKLDVAMSHLKTCWDKWDDLPNFVKTEEYMECFKEFIRGRINLAEVYDYNASLTTKEQIEEFVEATLHHETPFHMPYFKFERRTY